MACIDGGLLGEGLHLLHDTERGTFRWVDAIPPGAWVVGDPSADLSLDVLADLLGIELPRDPGERFRKPFELLASGSSGVRWRQAIPQAAFDGFVRRMLECIRGLLVSDHVAYYTSVLRRTRGCLGALGRMRVDRSRLEAHRSAEPNETNRSALLSFTPEADGLARPIRLNQVSTVTGRLTIDDGPRILTLPKRYRDIIVSRFEGGRVVTLDYTSLEPRVILLELGRVPPPDVYTHISDAVLGGTVTRAQAKVVTISLLYGASMPTVERVSGLRGSDLRHAIDAVSGFFGIGELHELLLSRLRADGTILNHYGRPVRVNDKRKLVNYFSQSSAVDAALLGFAGAIDEARENGWRIVAVAPIHDAMMFDVHPDDVRYIGDMARRSERVPGYGDATLPVKVEGA